MAVTADGGQQLLARRSGPMAALQALSEMPVLKQAGVMAGLALSVALGIWVVQWSRSPGYTQLFRNLAPKEATEVVAARVLSGLAAVALAAGRVECHAEQPHPAPHWVRPPSRRNVGMAAHTARPPRWMGRSPSRSLLLHTRACFKRQKAVQSCDPSRWLRELSISRR